MEADMRKPISFSAGASRNETKWRKVMIPLGEFLEGLTKHKAGEKDGKSFVPGVINGDGRRTEGNMRELHAMVFDIDDGTSTAEIELNVIMSELAAAVYTTHSHTDEHPKHRVVFALAEPFVVEDLDSGKAWWKAYRRAVAADLGFTDDTATDDLSRLFYLPRHADGAPHYSEVFDGKLLDLNDYDVDPGKIRKIERKGAATPEQILDHPVYKALSDMVIGSEGKKVFIHCPEEHMHTTVNNDRDATVFFDEDGVVGFTCLHQHAHLENGFGHSEFAEWLKRDRRISLHQHTLASPEDSRDMGDDGGDVKSKISTRHPSLVPGGTKEAIEWFNKRYFVVMNGNKVAVGHWQRNRENSGKELSLTTDAELFKLYQGCMVRKGDDDDKPKQAARVWFGSPRRKTYMNVVFEPSKPVPKDSLNLWQGFAVEPKPAGSESAKRGLGLILNHMREVLADGDPVSYEYILKWTANLFQHPEVPGPTALVFRSGQGTGKSRYTDLLRTILGAHGVQVSKADQIVGRFNSAIEGKSLVVANETFFAGNRQQTEQLKDLVTERTVLIERKNLDMVERPNVMKMVLTGNKEHIVSPDEDDRRFAIFGVSEKYAQNLAYHKPLLDACNDPEVQADFLHYCLNVEVSYEDLAVIPETQERVNQKALSLHGPAAWVHDLTQELIGLREDEEVNLGSDQEETYEWKIGHSEYVRIAWVGRDGVWLPYGSLYLHYQKWFDAQKYGREGSRTQRTGRSSLGAYLAKAGFYQRKRQWKQGSGKRTKGYGLNHLSAALGGAGGGEET